MHSFFRRPGLSNQTYTITEEHNGEARENRTDVYEAIGEARLIGQSKRGLKYSDLTQPHEPGQGAQQPKRPIAVAPPVAPPVAPKPFTKQAQPSGETPTLPERKPATVSIANTVQQKPRAENNYSNVATKFIPADRGPVPPAPKFPETIPPQTTVTPKKFQQKIDSTETFSIDVAKLTIDEVSQYLKELNLGQYVDKFKQQLVDGSILLELDKDVLKQDFGLMAVEAIRLRKFAETGHVPR